MSKYKGPQNGKKNQKQSFFEQMNQNKSQNNSAGNQPAQSKTTQDYKALDKLPIIKMQMNSKKETLHFEAAYQYALAESDPNSNEVLTVHLDMNDELHFNLKQDEAFQHAWEKGELMLLIAFPRNWKTMPMESEPDFDDDEADYDFDTDEDRFDYLYETGMSVYED